MLEFIRVDVGDGGSLSCTRCGAPRAVSFRDAEEVATAITSIPASRLPTAGILLGGADAFRHPSLPRLVSTARDAGATRIALLTRGGGLGVQGNATGAIEAGVRTIVVPILAGTDDVHDALAGDPGAFEAMRVGVRAFIDAARALSRTVSVHVTVEVCEHNAGHLTAAVLSAASLGATSVTADLARLPSADPELLRAAADTGLVNSVWVSFSGVDSDALGAYALHAIPPIHIAEEVA